MAKSESLAVNWGAAAVNDFRRIVEFVRQENPPAASRIFAAIAEKVEQLPSHPLIHRVGRVEGTREMLGMQTYVVVCRVGEFEIRIRRVLHTSQQWP